MELITERLLIEELTTTDHLFMFELVNTEGWLQFIGDRNIYTPEAAVAYIQKIVDHPDYTYWVMRLKEDQRPVGVISFLKREYLAHFDIGFALLPAFEGHGYAFEGAKEVLKRVCNDPKHTQILATTLPENRASIKLLKKLGLSFSHEIQVGALTLHVYGATTAHLLQHLCATPL